MRLTRPAGRGAELEVGGMDASTERGRRQAERSEMIMVGTRVTGKGWKLRAMRSVAFLDLLLSNSQ